MTTEELSQKLTEYATLVNKMREEQTAFFNTKNYNRLRTAKAMEQVVDMATDAILQAKPKASQQSMF